MRSFSVVCIVAFALVLIGPRPAHASEAPPGGADQERWVEVVGEASVNVAPDFATVTLGVTTAGKDAREAVAANAKAVNSLISVVKAEGVAPADIQTSSLSITRNSPTRGPAARTGSRSRDTTSPTW